MSRKKPRSSGKSSFKFKNIFHIAKKLALWFFALSFLWVLVYRFINPPVTWLMTQRGIERKLDDKEWKIEKKWRSFDELSSNLKYAAMAGEDVHFLKHWGFDAESIQSAYEKNKAGKPMRGGSTISQQVAKNVFLWPGRSWIRKGFEAYFTVLIELLWNKKRIMEVYLNVIEMGDGIYGAEAATQFYYNKPATKLSKRQAALLVAVLPNPRRWTPAKPTAYIYKKQYLILRNMRRIRNLKFD
ncbi:MAG: monofunctional biosynthetic peptidoglycan transglycosylase [Sphingobacteriaceae bacterium]